MTVRIKGLFLVGFSVLMCAAAVPCEAQSLWACRDKSFYNFIRDTQARQVGDLVTIVISENTDVGNKDERSLDKSSNAGFKFDFSSAAQGNGAAHSGSANVDTSTDSNRKFDGSSELTVEQEFSDRITVSILDVFPNGNLLVGGKRCRTVAGETRTLVVSGIVRALDVRGDNTVESQYIADFRVGYQGMGPESSFRDQGWLGKRINRIWPF